MQTFRQNYRFRGYRESRALADLSKAAASDLARLRKEQEENEVTAEGRRDEFTAARETDVRKANHLRAQLEYYLRNNR